MLRFESEALEFLLKRRHRLRGVSGQDRLVPGGQDGLVPGGQDAVVPGGHWFDTEALPAPVDEEARRELAQIDAALERIAQGLFGTCLACGGPMGMQRMRAIPEARYCVGCSGQVPEVE